MGPALHTGVGWTGDLLIADWEETENHSAADIHVEACE